MKNIISLTLALPLALPLLIVAPTGLSGCATTQMTGQQTDDARVAGRVGRRLAADPDTDRLDIDVDVLDGVVTLRGKADDQQSADEAVRIAQATDGVKEVVNKLNIVADDAQDYENPEGRSDVGIRAAVGTKLLADPDVRRVNIDVDVMDGVVVLSGIVHDQEAKDAAERIATNVEGVLRVENELTVDPDDNTFSEDTSAGPGKTPPGEKMNEQDKQKQDRQKQDKQKQDKQKSMEKQTDED